MPLFECNRGFEGFLGIFFSHRVVRAWPCLWFVLGPAHTSRKAARDSYAKRDNPDHHGALGTHILPCWDQDKKSIKALEFNST